MEVLYLTIIVDIGISNNDYIMKFFFIDMVRVVF